MLAYRKYLSFLCIQLAFIVSDSCLRYSVSLLVPRTLVMKTLLLLLAAVCGGSANMFDVDAPSKLPGARCSNGCAAWADSNATIQGDNCH